MNKRRCRKKNVGNRIHHECIVGGRILHQIKDELVPFEHGTQRNSLLSAHIPFPHFSRISTLVHKNDFLFDIIYLFLFTRN